MAIKRSGYGTSPSECVAELNEKQTQWHKQKAGADEYHMHPRMESESSWSLTACSPLHDLRGFATRGNAVESAGILHTHPVEDSDYAPPRLVHWLGSPLRH